MDFYLDLLLGADKLAQGFVILFYAYHRWKQVPDKHPGGSVFLISLANLGMVVADAAVIVLGLLTFIVPQFMEIFAGMRMELPLATRCLFEGVAFLNAHCLNLFPFFFLVPIFLRNMAVTASGQKWILAIGQHLPLLAGFFGNLQMIEIWNIVQTLLEMGVPFQRALKAVLLNSRYQKIRGQAVEESQHPNRKMEIATVEMLIQKMVPGYLREILDQDQEQISRETIHSAIEVEKARLVRKLQWSINLMECGSIVLLGGFLFFAVTAIYLPNFGGCCCHCID